MQTNKYIRMILWITALIMINLDGCVDPFNPRITDNQQSLVIDGTITAREGYHYIRISRSAPYDNPNRIPEQGCTVEVLDSKGDRVQFYESESGLYEQWIDQAFLQSHQQYKLSVVTSDGKVYESHFETLLPGPPIRNVYYEIETKETADPRFPLHGIQFYVDLSAPSGFARNYRWELTETWEYHAKYLIRLFMDENKNFVDLGYHSDSLYYCWSTQPVQEIFTATTRNVQGDSLYKIPLHFVSGETKQLRVKYSLLVRQYALGDTAYQYWDMLKKQSQESGGLYESQPATISSNIYNTDDREEIVLGYFNVSSMTEKRIFVAERFTFFKPLVECQLEELQGGIPTTRLPRYVVLTDDGLKIAQRHCFDCTLSGGTIIKPDFWDE